MQKFPGRTLEELDNLDWLRLQRALEVGRVVDVETKRALLVGGKLKADAISAQDAQAIQVHDELFDLWEAEQGPSA